MSRPVRKPQETPPGSARGRTPLLVTGALLGVAALALLASRTLRTGSSGDGPALGKPSVGGPTGLAREKAILGEYGGSESCRQCHEEEYRQWKTSNHGLAERLVDPHQDRHAFSPSRSIGDGIETFTATWSNNAPEITAFGLSGKPETFTPLRVIGNDPLRQFLVNFPNGRVQTLEVAYDPHSNQWFNVFGNEQRKPGEWGHWSGRGMNWNSMCASCHNTRLLRNYDEAGDAYHTTMGERSVGCEACHGPMKAHNDWQHQFGKSGQADPTLKKLTPAQTLDTCGACHARRTELTADFKPGDRFLDSYDLVVVDATDRYYADGQVRAEDYEYASFLGSRMHLRGVTCMDCHNPHTMKTLVPGNWLCLRCHNGSYTNAPVIDPIAHSHHKVFGFASRPGTNGVAVSVAVNTDLTSYKPKEIAEQGGECVNCHMPQTVYMQRHWRHDHGFTIPDPLLTKQFGIPNACSRCHKDKSVEWALTNCDQWYGSKMDRPTRNRAQILARAQAGDMGAREPLLSLLDREDSPYWRAVEVGFLARWSARPELASRLVTSLEDTNALVRTSAAAALEPALTASRTGVAEALENSLRDPVRSVRIAAAASLGAKVAPGSEAGREFQRYLDANADQPTGQAQKGISCSIHNDLISAAAHFRKAVEWDPYSPPFRHELAVTLSGLNRPQEAMQVLEEACRFSPRDAESHFKLGLACNELGNLKRAAEELKAAVTLDPKHAAAWYNLGLAQNALGHPEQAIESLLRAQSADPEDARSPYARATILARLGRTDEARLAAQQALDQQPSFAEARHLLELLTN